MPLVTVAPPMNALSPGGVVSIGNFDGVHRGHRRMIGALVNMANRLNTLARVMTFDPPPLAILAPDRVPPQLTTLATRIELLKSCGVDEVIVYPTSHKLLGLTAEEFFEQFLIKRFGASGVVEGPNFCFGRGRTGNVSLLRTLCEQKGIPLEIIEPENIDGVMISSSEIRAALLSGEVRRAHQLLGRPYTITGRVGQGAQRGRQIGFPTANLHDIETLLPPAGVYCGQCQIDEAIYPVAMNIGSNPTFGEHAIKIEAHLIGYHGDLYGRMITVELLDRLRGIFRFSNIEELQKQLRVDISRSIELYTASIDHSSCSPE